MKATNVHWHEGLVSKSNKEELLSQKGVVIWLTGLSGSGKSSIARELETRLHNEKKLAYVLDGDNVRHGLNKDLGFSDEDRKENIRRISETANLFQDAGMIVITAFISPFKEDRDIAREIIPKGCFLEVFVDAPLDVCEERDPKGLYKKARAGEIPQFTGISSPYEPPDNAEITINTKGNTLEQSVSLLINEIKKYKFL